MVTVLTFLDALSDAASHSKGRKPHLLLGNGFSIACKPDIFVYGKLYEQADFSTLSPFAKAAFGALKTQDFERVIKALRDARTILAAYDMVPSGVLETLKADADGLRELLVETIAHSHPGWPGEIQDSEYEACKEFLAHFQTIYTLNYDLLLYWTLMHNEEGTAPKSDDGFRKSQDNFDASYVVWEPGQSHEQNTWFLHGALHVFDNGTEVQKYTWRNTGVRLIDQIRDALSRSYFPIFVSEGTSAEKLERIRHNDYLAKGYRSFSEIQGVLFILGHSLGTPDEHYINLIERGKVTRLYVGLHGNPSSAANETIVARAQRMANVTRRKRGPLVVSFYDSASAKVWG